MKDKRTHKLAKRQPNKAILPKLPEHLLLTSLVVPARHRNLVRRERLLAALHENTERRLILISAPAGFGKTSLLIDFAHDTTLPVCWYSADQSHDDERLFLEYLTAAILRRFPQLKGGRADQWVGDGGRPWDRVGFLTALINDLQERIDDYFVLIIDDFHLVENSEAINRSLDWLLDRAGDNFCLILSTRGLPDLSFLRLTAAGHVFALGGEELRFTSQEIQDLYAQRFAVRLPDEEAQRLAEVSEGWITGLLLSTQRLWHGAMEAFLAAKAKGGLLFEYLVKEVFEAQEPEVREFLLPSSIFPDLSPSFCDEVLGITRSAQILALIDRRNLFINLVDEKNKVYRYHHLFKEFLTQHFRSQNPRAWKDLHMRTGQALGARGRWEEAIGYLIEAEAFKDIGSLLEEIAPRALQEGRFRSIARWIDALPKRIMARHPYLVLSRSAAAIEMGQLSDAKFMSQRALREFLSRKDKRGTALALIQQANIYRFRGKLRRALTMGQQAIRACQGRVEYRSLEARASRILGILYGLLGDFQKSISWLEQALDLYQRVGDEPNAAYVATSLGEALRRQGNLLDADRFSYQALEKWRRFGNMTEESRLLNNLAVSHYYEGDYRRSLELFEEALIKAASSPAPAAEGNILVGLGDLYRDWGRLSEAKEKYQHALRIARSIEDFSLLLYTTDALAETCRREGDLPGARAYLQRALEMVKITGSRLDKARIYITAGLVAVDSGQISEARKKLLEAKTITEESQSSGELARALFALGTCDFASGRKQSALANIQSSLQIARARHIEFFLLKPEARPLHQFAAEKGIMTDYVSELLVRMEATSEQPPPLTLVIGPAGRTDHLEVRALGGWKIWINGQAVPRGALVGRQARELFFLLIDGEARTRDDIGIVFWPDLSLGRMKSIFHATTHRIRKALHGEWIRFDQVRNLYHFNHELDYWYDVEAFEQALASARRRRSEPRAALPEYRAAIDLYRGEFLPEVDAEWADQRREALARSFIDALVEAADILLGINEAAKAANYLTKAYEREPYREDLLRKVMVALALAGRRERAIELYQSASENFQKELGMGASVETVRLAEELRAGQSLPQRLLSYWHD